jgi:hypothetical protein
MTVKVVGKLSSENAGSIRRFIFFGETSDNVVFRFNAWMLKSNLNTFKPNKPDDVEAVVQLYSVSIIYY